MSRADGGMKGLNIRCNLADLGFVNQLRGEMLFWDINPCLSSRAGGRPPGRRLRETSKAAFRICHTLALSAAEALQSVDEVTAWGVQELSLVWPDLRKRLGGLAAMRFGRGLRIESSEDVHVQAWELRKPVQSFILQAL